METSESILFRICHLYPDVLNTSGDVGNLICLRKRLEWRGIDTVVVRYGVGEKFIISDYDLVYIGGGQEFDPEALTAELRRGKAAEIRAAVDDGVSFLATGGGYQVMGAYYETPAGTRYDLVAAADYHTIGSNERRSGNFLFRCGLSAGGSKVVGFENHSGRTFLGDSATPLGTVIYGGGNNGEDGTEGVHRNNFIGTNCGGPLLPKNPHLCDYIIRTALQRRHPDVEVRPLIDTTEHAAHDFMESQIRREMEKKEKSSK